MKEINIKKKQPLKEIFIEKRFEYLRGWTVKQLKKYCYMNDIQTFYHQVFLGELSYYAFYLSNTMMDNTHIKVHSNISTAIDNYTQDFFDKSFRSYLLYINPTTTGWYNITISQGEEGHYYSGSIGVLQIPIVQLL